MPRNVRNFWIEVYVDGKKTEVACGPRAKDGGFRARVFVRNQGAVESALWIVGTADSHGQLHVVVSAEEDRDVVNQVAHIVRAR